ncbi:MAG TPA: isoprenylcysteine carboxylmethyltransferase family protein [Terriglobia bacterium]|nr:isoprenylcysteine carboxylmethyltransferase family protein [Terriglobia bacterium]
MDKGFAAWAARSRVPLGFAWGAAYLIFCQPTARLIAAGGAVAFVGVLLRALSAGYLEKGRALATAGPYRYTRNPLYLGSFLIGAGFVIAGGSWALGSSFVVLFFLIYWTVMRREEAALRQQYAEIFDQYAHAVPLFVPVPGSRGDSTRPEERFRWERYRRNREYEASLGYLAGMVFLVLKMWLR